MPNAPVSVEIAPPESKESLRAVLLDACTRTVKDTECVENAPEGTPPAVVAIVSFRDPGNVHLEVAVRPEQRWVTRDIHFSEGDPPEERWRAVGLVIGTLASVMTKKEPEPPPPSPSEPVVLPPPSPSVAPEQSRETRVTEERVAWLAGGGLLGTALDRGPVRLGGELSGYARMAPRFFLTLAGSYSVTAGTVEGVRTSWLEGFFGAAYELDLGGAFVLSTRAEVGVERISPSLRSGAPDPTSGERWLGGARIGGDVYYWGAKPLGFFVGVAGRAVFGVTDIRVEETVIATEPAVGALLRAGIAFEIHSAASAGTQR